MPMELSLASAFIVGLIGSTHCLGMCGGIVSALTLGARPAAGASAPSLMWYLLAYNVGRIASYAVAGAAFGWASAHVLQSLPPTQAQWLGRWMSGAFMIALGLWLTGWWTGLGAIERAGAWLWKRIEPVGRRL